MPKCETVVAGIDEVGYGPKLGPLVVALTAFRVPDPAVDWVQALGNVLGRRPDSPGKKLSQSPAGDGAPALHIADSKRVYRRPEDLKKLEAAVLPLMARLGFRPRSFLDLTEAAVKLPQGQRSLETRFLSQDISFETLPVYVSQDFIHRASEELGNALGAAKILPLYGACCLVEPAEFNRRLSPASTGPALPVSNKADLLFTVFADLLKDFLQSLAKRSRRCSSTKVVVWAGKQGGRARYGSLLQRSWPGVLFLTREETPRRSRYEAFLGPELWIEIGFYENVEDAFLPAAWSSMLAKYVRELWMRQFNAFWQSLLPGLHPTAGYGSDAGRFLREIEPLRKRLELPEPLLVRSR